MSPRLLHHWGLPSMSWAVSPPPSPTPPFGINVLTMALDGIGPLLFSPLSEIPYIGRNPVYVITFAIFLVLSVAASVCQSFAGFLVVRFLQGFFGSPCLATGAASLSDMVRQGTGSSFTHALTGAVFGHLHAV